MSILVNENSRVLVQGITGREGSFHASACIAYGTNVVAGVTPGRGGQLFEDRVPVFDAVAQAVRETQVNVSLIFVPPAFAADAIAEAAAALRDGFAIRRAATERRLPCYTSMDTAKVAIAALSSPSTESTVATVKDYVEGLA